MPIDKAINQAPDADIVVFEEDAAPEIEIVLDEDGGAIVEIGEQEAKEVDFYANLAEVIEPEALARIAIDVSAMFEADKGSRSDWEQMYAKGLDLLGLRMEERTKPFRGAAGAAHPMLQESIIQFQAQAFRELMPAGGPVRTQILGKETVDKFQQAARVQDFMNYQITTVMEEYTPEFDQLLYYTGYGGSTFKKVYYDAQLGRMVSKLCLADDVYIPYNGSSVVSQCPRLTHRLAMDSRARFRLRSTKSWACSPQTRLAKCFCLKCWSIWTFRALKTSTKAASRPKSSSRTLLLWPKTRLRLSEFAETGRKRTNSSAVATITCTMCSSKALARTVWALCTSSAASQRPQRRHFVN